MRSKTRRATPVCNVPDRAFLLVLALFLLSCDPVAEPPLERGGLYSVEDGRGMFRPAKIIAYDSNIIHIRLYSNALAFRPDTMIVDTLRLAEHPGELPSYEHFPMSRHLFISWGAEYAGSAPVTPDELEMVEEWKNSGAGVVGGSW